MVGALLVRLDAHADELDRGHCKSEMERQSDHAQQGDDSTVAGVRAWLYALTSIPV